MNPLPVILKPTRMRMMFLVLIVGVLLTPSTVLSQTRPDSSDQRQEVEALRNEVEGIRGRQNQNPEVLLWGFGILVTAFLTFTVANYFVGLHTSNKEMKALGVLLRQDLLEAGHRELLEMRSGLRREILDAVREDITAIQGRLDNEIVPDLGNLAQYVFLNQAKLRARRGDFQGAVDAAVVLLRVQVNLSKNLTNLGPSLEHLENYIILLIWAGHKPSADLCAKVSKTLGLMPREYHPIRERILGVLVGTVSPPPKPEVGFRT